MKYASCPTAVVNAPADVVWRLLTEPAGIPLNPTQCRVDYHCNFDLPDAWRGVLLRLILRRELDRGPVGSLLRLLGLLLGAYAEARIKINIAKWVSQHIAISPVGGAQGKGSSRFGL